VGSNRIRKSREAKKGERCGGREMRGETILTIQVPTF